MKKILQNKLCLFFLLILATLISPNLLARNVVVINDFIKGQSNHLDRNLIDLMIVPNLASYQAIKDRIEKDFHYRTLLGAISKNFERQGYTVKDFMENLAVSERRYQVQKTLYTDPFDFLIKNAPVEVFIYVDILMDDFGEGEKQVSLQLSAKDKYTADRYATTSLLSSTRRRWPNMHRPAEEALKQGNSLTNFVSQLDQKLLDLREKGRKVDVHIESLEERRLPLNQKLVGNKSLGFLISEWINENSLTRSNPNISSKLFVCEANIPVYFEDGKRYSPLDFGFVIQRYIENLDGTEINEVELKVAGKMIYLYIK